MSREQISRPTVREFVQERYYIERGGDLWMVIARNDLLLSERNQGQRLYGKFAAFARSMSRAIFNERAATLDFSHRTDR
jgi:hypothetical protein